MNLGELRTKFREFSGRYDLDDSGVDFFINAGVRFIESRVESVSSLKRYQKDLQPGDYFIDAPGLVGIKSVWMSTADGKRKLRELGIDEVRQMFGTAYDKLDRSLPKYYAIVVTLFAGDQTMSPPTTTYDTADISGITGVVKSLRVLVLPPTDVVCTVTIFGLFSPADLVNPTDVNYWTEQYPDVVLHAALYKLETFYRNTEGANDWKNALAEDFIGIASDFVEYVVGERTVMEG